MTARRIHLVVAAMIAIGAAAACGGSPGGPSLNLAGAWSGTLTYVTAGVMVTDTVTTTLNQSGSSVTGGWTSAGGTTGQFSLNASADITGTTTISQTTITGQVCSGSTPVSGTATSSRLELALATLTPTSACPWAANQLIVLTR